VQITDINDADGGVFEVSLRRLSALNLNRILRYKNATREEFVFVGAAWMGENGIDHGLGKVGTVGIDLTRATVFAFAGQSSTSKLRIPSVGN